LDFFFDDRRAERDSLDDELEREESDSLPLPLVELDAPLLPDDELLDDESVDELDDEDELLDRRRRFCLLLDFSLGFFATAVFSLRGAGGNSLFHGRAKSGCFNCKQQVRQGREKMKFQCCDEI
jgi:hypothetical protein